MKRHSKVRRSKEDRQSLSADFRGRELTAQFLRGKMGESIFSTSMKPLAWYGVTPSTRWLNSASQKRFGRVEKVV
jgi:hypothetical protein